MTRDEIAAALEGVPGVAPSSVRPPILDAGASWPVKRSETPTHGGCAIEARWYVLVVAPNGLEEGTIAATDPIIRPVLDALKGAGLVVEIIEPVRVPVETGQQGVPAIRVSVIDHLWVG